MINKSVSNLGIALATLVTLAVVTPARAQFSTVAFGGFNFGAGILAGERGGSSQFLAQTKSDLAASCLALNSPGLVDPGWTPGAAAPVASASGKSISLPAHNQGSASGATGLADPVPGPTYASLGVIGAALVCGWCWKKPERRTP